MCEVHRGQGNSVKASKRCEDSSGALRNLLGGEEEGGCWGRDGLA